MKTPTPTRRLAAAAFASLVLAAGCSSDGSDGGDATPTSEAPTSTVAEESTTTTSPDSTTTEAAPEPEPPAANIAPVNPFLADSAVPIAHFDSAQTDSVPTAGPTGPTATLSAEELDYTHLGPAHFGIAISPQYSDGRRTIWSNGGDRISKLDYETLDVIAELPLPGKTLMPEDEAEANIAALDSLEGDELGIKGVEFGAKYLFGISGVYYMLDVDNTLFVGGSESIIAYQDTEPDNPDSAIELRNEWFRPADVTGTFAGANMTFDGRIAMITNEGWIVVVERDFSDYQAIQLVGGAENAAAHNQAMVDAGARPGAADWVRNSLAIDEDGGIYAISKDHVHKVIWNGETLSTDPADGAWTEPYLSTLDGGSGATPSLMGFGEEDRFVVLTDGEVVMNVVLFWRDDIPEGWVAPEGAPSPRIAGQLPATIGDPNRASIQTEQSPVVAENGVMVVNNDPASVPDDFPGAGVRVLAGFAGNDPAFTPKGLEKFEWNSTDQVFESAWVNTEVSSANAVPVVSTGSGLVYTVGGRDGDWTMEALDWATGESAFHFVTGSSRYNTLYSGMNIDQDGRIIHTTPFGIVRYNPAG